MKELVIEFVSLFNKFWFKVVFNKYGKFSGTFYLVRLIINRNNKLDIDKSNLLKTAITIKGMNNVFSCKNSYLINCTISISGINNELYVDEKVYLRNTNIIIRGGNCKIFIGEGTTTGGIRLVNVGENNNLTIGKYCLFSDYIEVWSSDTHSIYDDNGECINEDKSITICDKVWVGSRSIILKGVTINRGSVIGMGTIVTKDVPAKTVSIGTPNRVVKENITWSLDHRGDTFLQ